MISQEDILKYYDLKAIIEEENEDIKAFKEKQKIDLEKRTANVKELQESLAKMKENLEKEALNEYEKTKSKKLIGGLGIRISKTKSYDEEKALEWAKKSGTCLLLDKKMFEKVGPTMTDLVTIKEETKVTFPKKLK